MKDALYPLSDMYSTYVYRFSVIIELPFSNMGFSVHRSIFFQAHCYNVAFTPILSSTVVILLCSLDVVEVIQSPLYVTINQVV